MQKRNLHGLQITQITESAIFDPCYAIVMKWSMKNPNWFKRAIDLLGYKNKI